MSADVVHYELSPHLLEAVANRAAEIALERLRRELPTGRRRPAERDLPAELVRFLAKHPGATTVAVARGVRARDQEVRGCLLATQHS